MGHSDLLSAESHFAFGKNWLNYAQKIDEQMISQAIIDLKRLSGNDRFDGLSFLDIGCGSGLHSLAAIRMGASSVVGVDIDAESVEASRRTLKKFSPDSDAEFRRISVLDMKPEQYADFDFVYSWGVLHHTGDMYRALTAAASLVRPSGVFMVALYKKTFFCGMWRVIKRWYSSTSSLAQRRAMSAYISLHKFLYRMTGKRFDEKVRNYHGRRGMNYYNDVHDWMGGFPYESIDPAKCRDFFHELGFDLEREFIVPPKRFLPGILGSGCDEYVFRKAN